MPASFVLQMAHVLRVDPKDVPKRNEEIDPFDLGTADVFPGVERELVDPFGSQGGRSNLRDVAGENFNVKDPASHERIGEQRASLRANAKYFRAALRVVDGHAQHDRHHGGEYPAQVVAAGAAVDLTSEQLYASAENHIEIGPRGQDGEELGNSVERRGKIGIPKSDQRGVLFQSEVDAQANRFRLASIDGRPEQAHAVRVSRAQALNALNRVVPAAIIHENEVDFGLGQESLKLVHRETQPFVVAGHDDHARRIWRAGTGIHAWEPSSIRRALFTARRYRPAARISRASAASNNGG